MEIKTTICIGDPHAEPDHPNDRFSALGNFLLERQPDNIIQMGDFFSFDSLSFHDRHRPLVMEGKRLQHDVEAGRDAYSRMVAPIVEFNTKQQEKKKKQYSPNGVWLNGNHEDRVWRYVAQAPELDGFVTLDGILPLEQHGWTVVPYKATYVYRGVGFTHIPINNSNNNRLSGKYVCLRAAEQSAIPLVFAHTHKFQELNLARTGDNTVIRSINVGWFGDFIPHYIDENTALDWWNGVVLLHHYADGKFDIETISMERLKADYL